MPSSLPSSFSSSSVNFPFRITSCRALRAVIFCVERGRLSGCAGLEHFAEDAVIRSRPLAPDCSRNPRGTRRTSRRLRSCLHRRLFELLDWMFQSTTRCGGHGGVPPWGTSWPARRLRAASGCPRLAVSPLHVGRGQPRMFPDFIVLQANWPFGRASFSTWAKTSRRAWLRTLVEVAGRYFDSRPGHSVELSIAAMRRAGCRRFLPQLDVGIVVLCSGAVRWPGHVDEILRGGPPISPALR